MLGLGVIAGGATPAAAASGGDMLDLEGLQALPDSALTNYRGGFSFGGFNVAFGVTIQAAIDGATVLKTTFNVLRSNVISDPTVSFLHNGNVVYSSGGGDAGPSGMGIPVPNQDLVQVTGGTGSTGAVTTTTNGQVLASANGYSLLQLADGGYAIASPHTSIIQSVGQGGIVSEISNTANDRLIQTSLSLNVFFTNFAQMAGRADMTRMVNNLFSEHANAAALGH